MKNGIPNRRPRLDEPLTINTPLTVGEQHFLANYIKFGNLTEAVENTPELNPEGRSRASLSRTGQSLMRKINVKAEYERIVEEARKQTIAAASEVMEYFTRVMRGEEKDQFGLDAPLSEKTRAAIELAKRTIDIENRQSGNADQVVEVKLDWTRD